jgi:hypothetical protein
MRVRFPSNVPPNDGDALHNIASDPVERTPAARYVVAMRNTTAALAAVAALAACKGDDHHDEDPTGNPCRDGTYQLVGAVTDEACISYVDAEKLSVTDDTKAPKFTDPMNGTKFSRSTPPRFAWTRGTLARTNLHRILRYLSPVSEAWAHGEINGDAFVLSFRDATGKELHRVLTDALEYTPDAAAWAKIRVASSVQVVLTGVRFTKNAIATGTRPTSATPLSRTLEG